MDPYGYDTQYGALMALASQRAMINPEYAKAVLRAYVQSKLIHGNNRSTTSYKLDLLEGELISNRYPNYGPAIVAVRSEFQLGPSRYHKFVPSTQSASSPSALTRHTSHLTPSSSRPTNSTANRRVSSPAAARPAPRAPVVREPAANTSGGGGTAQDDDAPPAYTRIDENPDPDLAAALLASLSTTGGGEGGVERPPAMDGSNGGASGEYAPPPGPPPPSASSHHQQQPSSSSRPAALASTTSYASPPGPPPSHIISQSSFSNPSNSDNPSLATPLAPSLPPRSPFPPSGPSSSSGAADLSSSSQIELDPEDPLCMLYRYDTLFLIDDSTSMDRPPPTQTHSSRNPFASHLDPPPPSSSQPTSWSQTYTLLSTLLPLIAAATSPELLSSSSLSRGFFLQFLNNTDVKMEGITSQGELREVWEAVGAPTDARSGTSRPLGARLEEVLVDYWERVEGEMRGKGGEEGKARLLNVIVMTDGASLGPTHHRSRNPFSSHSVPTDDPESVIVAAARRLDVGQYPLSQLGIFFLQIGTDPAARTALQELDENLASKHGIRDIAGSRTFVEGDEQDGEVLRKILLGGINRSIDRQQR